MRWSVVMVAFALAARATHAAEPQDFDSLWKQACLWEVGSNTEKVPAARQALVAKGEPVLDFLIPAKLDTKDTLVTRALNVVVTGIGKPAVPRLVAALESDNANVRRNAADLLGALQATESAPAIARLLGDKDSRMGALSALGALKARDVVPRIAELLDADVPERVRVTSAVTLGQIGGPDAIVTLARHLGDAASAVRFACQYALETKDAVPTLRSLLKHPDMRVRLHAIAALGHIGTPAIAARPELLPLLADVDPIVRGFAAEAIAAMKRPDDLATLRSRMAGERNAFVRGKLEPGLTP